MRKLLIAILMAIPFIGLCQQPDMKKIEKNILNQGSVFYYPNMMNRYLACDTTLTIEQYENLYYGYVFSDGFDPEKTTTYPPSLNIFNQKGVPTPDDYKMMIDDLNRALVKDPFNLSFLNLLSFCYDAIGDKDNHKRNLRRFGQVMFTIYLSGTGISANSPMCVIYRRQIEEYMTSMNYLHKKPEMTSAYTYYVPLVTKDGGVEGYFFKIVTFAK